MENIPHPHCIKENIWLVPCMVQKDSTCYIPLFKPFSTQLFFSPQFRNSWDDPEDNYLKTLVEEYGTKRWKAISKALNKAIYKGIAIRNSKQCRERWINHVNPVLNKDNWAEQEDLFIIENQKAMGNKWSEIAKNLKGRTENSVKNRWKCLLNKAKKMYKNHSDPLVEYVRVRKEENNPKSVTSNQSFFQMSPFNEIQFSSIAETFRGVYATHISPSFQDVSPSSLLFFNN